MAENQMWAVEGGMLFFLVDLTQSLVAYFAFFVLNLSALNLFLQMLEKMRIFFCLALGDRYAFH